MTCDFLFAFLDGINFQKRSVHLKERILSFIDKGGKQKSDRIVSPGNIPIHLKVTVVTYLYSNMAITYPIMLLLLGLSSIILVNSFKE